MRRLAIATAAGLSAALACNTGTALADNGWGSTSCSQTPSPACDLAAGTRPTANKPNIAPGTTNGRSPGDVPVCRNIPVNYDPPGSKPQGPGGWFMVICSPDGKDPDSHGPVWIPAGASTPTPSPEEVAQIARKRLRLPAPTITASPSGTQLVHLPTWLWLSSGWTTTNSTASVPGVAVTAVAIPVSTAWSTGDGHTVTCAGPGTPFPHAADPQSSSPDCGHTYRRSSAREPGQAFTVSVTVQWNVTWSGAGQGGAFPNLTTTATTTFRVAESQALNTHR